MPLTRAFKCGDDQAVRIPAELAYEDMTVEFSITRHGDTIVIAPVRSSLKEMVAQLRAMPKPASVEVYEPIELPDRELD
jgi:antitoxin VapB